MDVCQVNGTSSPPGQRSPDSLGLALHASAFTASLLFGLPVNGTVLWLVLRGRRERIASDFILLNQMLVEIILSFTSVWYFLQVFLWDRVFMRVFLFSSLTFLVARPLAQSFLCLEQYLAVIHPLTFLRCKPLRYRLACGCASWTTVSVFSTTATVVDFASQRFLIVAALYLCFMLLMTFCCVSVLRALKRPGPGERLKDQQKGNGMKRRAFIIITINLVQSTSFQVPMALFTFLNGSIPSDLFSILTSLSIWTSVLTGFVPALLYLYRVKMIPKICCLKHM